MVNNIQEIWLEEGIICAELVCFPSFRIRYPCGQLRDFVECQHLPRSCTQERCSYHHPVLLGWFSGKKNSLHRHVRKRDTSSSPACTVSSTLVGDLTTPISRPLSLEPSPEPSTLEQWRSSTEFLSFSTPTIAPRHSSHGWTACWRRPRGTLRATASLCSRPT